MRSRHHSLLGSVALLLGTIAVVIFFSGSESLPSIVAANGAANGPAKVASQAAAPATNAATGPSGYHLLKTIKLGGEGFWDYLAFDSPTRRLFISRGTKVVVLDVDSEKVVGEIPDTQGIHGIALAPELHDGFTSNGMAGTVTIFDMSTLQVIGHADAALLPSAETEYNEQRLYDLSRGCNGEQPSLRLVAVNNSENQGPLNRRCPDELGSGEKYAQNNGEQSAADAIDKQGDEVFFTTNVERAATSCFTGDHQVFVRLAGAKTRRVFTPIGRQRFS